MPGQDLEAARLQVQVDDRHHREQRSQQGIEEELEGRIHAVRAAPHPDDDVHRDQRRLEEHVEQHAVSSREHPDHQAGEDQERPQVLMDAILDDFPAKTRKPIPKIVFFMIITSLHLTFLLLTDNNA